MTSFEKVLVFLSALFSGILIVGNLTYQKFVIITIPTLYNFEISVGTLLYPITYLITDLIAEFFGRDKAKFCVKCAIIINIIIALVISLMGTIPSTSWSYLDDTMFEKIFGVFFIALLSSMIASYLSQLTDITIYLWIKKATKSKYLWLRNIGSVSVSLLVDTVIVVTIMTFFDLLPTNRYASIIIDSYSFKLLFSICSIPLFYLANFIVVKLLKRGTSTAAP